MEYTSSDEEFQEQQPIPWSKQQSVIIGIDCSPSMFEKDKENNQVPFQSALNAVYKLMDSLIFQGSFKYKISIQFHHSDPIKCNFMDFDSSFTESFLKLQDLIAEESFSKLSCTDAVFKDFIVTCKKIFRKDKAKDVRRTLFYITNNPDPSRNDDKVKFHAMQEFEEFEAEKISFELLPLAADFDYNPFYKEVCQVLDIPIPNYYYDQEFLVIKLDNTIMHTSVHRNLNIYLGPNVSQEACIPCRIRKYTHKARLTKIKVTRDGNNEVKKETLLTTDEKYHLLTIKSQSFKLSAEDREKFLKVSSVGVGLTMIHASKTRYSTFGENLRAPQMLSAKDNTDKNFIALWEACNAESFNLLCYLKFTSAGKIYYAELIPKILNQDRQFLVLMIPQSHNISYQEQEEDNASMSNDELKSVIDDLVDAATIENYDITKMKPYKYQKQIEYLKQEILGPKAIINKIDLVKDKLYEGNVDSIVEKLKELCPVPEAKGSKRRAAPASKAVKKSKK